MLTVALVIGLSNTTSGAASSDSLPLTPAAPELTDLTPRAHKVTQTESCKSARKALRFYRAAYRGWRDKMGQAVVRVSDLNPPASCPRYLSKVWRAKAHAARKAYERWHVYHWRWDLWLPAKWQRIGACETGYGRRPGNWRHSNSSYEGAFGFALSSWDAFVPRADPKAGPYPANAYLATPRQQYEVALAIWRMYGLSGWGCRGA